MLFLSINTAFVIISLIFLHFDRRNFFAGVFLIVGIIDLLLSGFVYFIGQASSSSPQAQSTIILFVLLGLLGILMTVGISMILNTHIMQKREGKSMTAKLSLFFGVNALIILGLAYIFLAYSENFPIIINAGIFFVLITDILFSTIFISYLFYSFLYQVMPIKYVANYIITLGAGVRSEKISPLLQSRLDRAIEYLNDIKPAQAKMVVSGGQGPDEPVSEAFAMGKYLRSQSIPKEIIIEEDKSTNTYQNMLFSKKLIMEDWEKQGNQGTPKVVFSTNNYHVLRGAIYARRAGLNADGIGAPTSFYFLPSALLREFIALLVIYRWFTVGLVLFSLLISIAILV
ncbi:YdcF family protein [Lentilactobacillus sp. Marseille-Q4993]|uniref:YdcF family protein n=1 Tax=Lentilactobacillus sp. Marseille-Q4993 TaxID=3039492 RepID=UPI0024BCEF92|nr:YdcF family protein [Lentilactobacillus sp. Marseille-Q4993]